MPLSAFRQKLAQALVHAKHHLLAWAEKLLGVIEPLTRSIRRTYRQERAHLARILAPQKQKWFDPLWHNLRPLVVPVFLALSSRLREWVWQPLVSVAERLAPTPVARWRALPLQQRQRWLTGIAVALVILLVIIPERPHHSADSAIHDPDIIDLSQDLLDPDSPQWAMAIHPVEIKPFSEILRVSGKVEFDEQRVAPSKEACSPTGPLRNSRPVIPCA